MIAGVLAFHARQRDRNPAGRRRQGTGRSLQVLFGEGGSDRQQHPAGDGDSWQQRWQASGAEDQAD
jgi:hypothetical protein